MTKERQMALNTTDEWLLTHRVDLHNALRTAATKEVNGRKINLRLSSRVLSVVCHCAPVMALIVLLKAFTDLTFSTHRVQRPAK